MSTQMSVTRALAEVKMLGKRIEKRISEFVPVVSCTGKQAPAGFDSVEEFEKHTRSEYAAILDMLARRNAIKAQVIKSNAATEVEIAGKPMSVAEAIDMKSSIQHNKLLANRMSRMAAFVEDKITILEREADAKLQNQLTVLLGSDRKNDESERRSVEDAFKERHWPKLRDPLKVRTKIEEQNSFIDEFTANVDFVLSESNARTMIEID